MRRRPNSIARLVRHRGCRCATAFTAEALRVQQPQRLEWYASCRTCALFPQTLQFPSVALRYTLLAVPRRLCGDGLHRRGAESTATATATVGMVRIVSHVRAVSPIVAVPLCASAVTALRRHSENRSRPQPSPQRRREHSNRNGWDDTRIVPHVHAVSPNVAVPLCASAVKAVHRLHRP
jgi:hypothetical protein